MQLLTCEKTWIQFWKIMEGAEHETILCETLFSKFRRALLHKLEYQRSEHRNASNNNGKNIENYTRVLYGIGNIMVTLS